MLNPQNILCEEIALSEVREIVLWVASQYLICTPVLDAITSFQILVPSEIFDMDKVMAALAYQVDPESVEIDDFSMFRPRKKSNVLSSR